METVTVYNYPVSGGFFVNQLAASIVIAQGQTHIKPSSGKYKIEKRPSLLIGSSGGNVAMYVACGMGWDENGIRSFLEHISSKAFVRPWAFRKVMPGGFGLFALTWFKKTMFDSPPDTVITSLLLKEKVELKPYELWTGTENKDKSRAQFFCNRNVMNTKLGGKDERDELLGVLPPMYMDHQIDLIGKVIKASASIPIVVKPQKIGTQEYIDGGCSFPDPLMGMLHRVMRYAKRKPLHIVTVYGFDPTQLEIENYMQTVIHQGMWTTTRIQGSMMIQGRNRTLMSLGLIENVKKEEGMFTPSFWSGLHRRKEMSIQTSLLEIFPLTPISINVTSFTSEELIQHVHASIPQIGYRLWFK